MNSEALLTFFAYATELEQEAEERYSELADVMAAHNNQEVAAFFRRMAEEASNHLAEVTLLCAGEALPTLNAWEFEWPDKEPPETVNHEAVHYRMTLAEAMQMALRNEHAAARFYRDYGERSDDPQVKRIAEDFAAEEQQHAQQLELMLQEAPAVDELSREEDDPPHEPE